MAKQRSRGRELPYGSPSTQALPPTAIPSATFEAEGVEGIDIGIMGGGALGGPPGRRKGKGKGKGQGRNVNVGDDGGGKQRGSPRNVPAPPVQGTSKTPPSVRARRITAGLIGGKGEFRPQPPTPRRGRTGRGGSIGRR